MKPQRARDIAEVDLPKLFEISNQWYVFNKYDGIRCQANAGSVDGKSLLPHPNHFIQATYGKEEYNGFEFEVIVTENGIYDPTSCCRKTTSFLNSFHEVVEHQAILFDNNRLHALAFHSRFQTIQDYCATSGVFKVPEFEIVTSVDKLLEFELKMLKQNMEGIIIRNPSLPYRPGESSPRGELFRLKRYIHEEAEILEVFMAKKNNNEAKINALGLQERSSHKANMEEKEEIIGFVCRTIKDIHDPWSGRLLFPKGTVTKVSATTIKQDERRRLYPIRDQLIGKLIKFKSFPKGTKDQPRFPNFDSFVGDSDKPF